MLLLLGCVHPSAPGAVSGAVPSPAPVATDATEAVPVVPLDEAGLASLLQNPSDAPLVVNFWATWCGPCVGEMGTLRAAAAMRPDVHFALVSVDDVASASAVNAFVRSRAIGLPAFQLFEHDPSAVLARHVEGWPDLIPVTLVLDPGGAVRTRFDGVVNAASLDAALR